MLVVRISDESRDDPDPTGETKPRYQIRMQSLITINENGGSRQYRVEHTVSRFSDGTWSASTVRDGHQTTMSGDGVVPALIDADGMVVIVLAAFGPHAQSSPQEFS